MSLEKGPQNQQDNFGVAVTTYADVLKRLRVDDVSVDKNVERIRQRTTPHDNNNFINLVDGLSNLLNLPPSGTIFNPNGNQ